MTEADLASMFEHHKGGLHLKDTLLWFDAEQPRELSFVSHALVPGALDHEKIICTDRTARLLRAMTIVYGRGRRAHQAQVLVTPFRRTFAIGALSLELFPAGYVLGSASLMVKHQGATVVYAGQINPASSGEIADRLEAQRCDVLVLPGGVSARRLALPPAEDVKQQLLRFVRQTLDDGRTPVLLCPVVGEAQLLVSLLAAAGLSLRLHRQIFAACSIYREELAGRFELLGARRYERPLAADAGEVLLWPVALHRSPSLAKQERSATALVSPLAGDPEARERVGCEAGFPLSAHADYRGLLEYVRACDPKVVVLTGAHTRELRDDLSAQGVTVSEVGPRQQLSLF